MRYSMQIINNGKRSLRRAYTMIELVLVIVVLGIVASIGAEIISKLYDNYIYTRSVNRLQSQTELVLDQIARRLTYRIKDSVIARLDNTTFHSLSNSDVNESYNILEWIGRDNESFRGDWNGTANVPGWTGFIDLYSTDTNKTQIKTSGSHLGYARDIIYALSYGGIDINNSTSSTPHAVIIFKGKDDYNVSKYGWNGSGTNDANYTYNIKVKNDDTLEILDKNITTAYEQYDLAWSAYAIVPEGSNNKDFNLTLKYNFQPWDGERYDEGNSSVLMEHVSTFRFLQSGETIRIKLCIRDTKINGDYSFCKERVIF